MFVLLIRRDYDASTVLETFQLMNKVRARTVDLIDGIGDYYYLNFMFLFKINIFIILPLPLRSTLAANLYSQYPSDHNGM